MRKQKFNRTKEQRAGMWFDSRLEASVYDHLSDLQEKGEISDLKCQVEVRLTRANILSKLDFSFIENGVLIFAEAKGFPTPVWNIKKRLWKHYGPGELRIYKGSYKKFYLHETVHLHKDALK